MVASVLLVALLTTLECRFPTALLGTLASSSQAAQLHHSEEGIWTTYDTSNSGLESDCINAIAVDNDANIRFTTYGGEVSKYGFATPPPTPTSDLRDLFEPDDTYEDAKPIAIGETQTHNLYPDGDVDMVWFGVKEGLLYALGTSNLATGTDTAIMVTVNGTICKGLFGNWRGIPHI